MEYGRFENETGRRRRWLKDNILDIPAFKEEIKKFGHYPINKNDEYRFVGSKMKQFLEDNFKRYLDRRIKVSKLQIIKIALLTALLIEGVRNAKKTNLRKKQQKSFERRLQQYLH